VDSNIPQKVPNQKIELKKINKLITAVVRVNEGQMGREGCVRYLEERLTVETI